MKTPIKKRLAKWLSTEVVIVALAFLAIALAWSTAGSAADFSQLQHAAKAEQIEISAEQTEQLQAKQLTAALVWHGSSPWVHAVTRGAKATFAQLGIKVVAVTDAQFDPAKQVADLENISALEPDIILSLSVDGISTKASYQKATKNGAKLVLLSNPIPDFKQGEDYVGIVTDDMFGMGRAAAQMLAESIQGLSLIHI